MHYKTFIKIVDQLSFPYNDTLKYCEGIFRNTGVSCFCVINNSQQVISILNSINTSSKAKHFDFSTLYTSIPHTFLKDNMNVLIDEAYKIRGATYISLNRKGKCCWAQSRGAFMSIDKYELVTMIAYLVDNIFVQAGNKIFRQGIVLNTYGH